MRLDRLFALSSDVPRRCVFRRDCGVLHAGEQEGQPVIARQPLEELVVRFTRPSTATISEEYCR